MKEFSQIFFSYSPKMMQIKKIMGAIARSEMNILIKGESGTGKDLVAKGLHSNSPRRGKPFIKVNCATIPGELLESELFGFEKGAFTGAHTQKPGKFELANGGMILLDEIGELDLSIQAKLLQVLQDGFFPRLGGRQDIQVDTCVITTTKDYIERSVLEGTFREDLYYRINGLSLTVPPLRERKEQIQAFVDYYLSYYQSKYKKKIPRLGPDIITTFKGYEWPGNIRELENTIKRMVLLGEVQHFPLGTATPETLLPKKAASESIPAATRPDPQDQEPFDIKDAGKKAAEEAERSIIQKALKHTHWNRKEAAKLLQVSYKALLYKIVKYHLDGFKNQAEGRQRGNL